MKKLFHAEWPDVLGALKLMQFDWYIRAVGLSLISNTD